MPQSRARAPPIPFSTLLALTTLFSLSTASPSPSLPRMEMPDSPPPPPPPSSAPPPPNSYWNFATNGLPVSYRVAIIIDAFVLVVTIVSLCLLGWYMRNQYRKRRLLHLIHEQRIEEGLDREIRERRKGGKGGKKGHVRWGSSVQGGSVDLDEIVENGKGEGKGKGYIVRGTEVEVFTPEREGKRVDPLGGLGMGKAKSSPMVAEFKGDPLGKGKGIRLWEREERERQRRSGQRVGAGYDGFRGS